MLGDGQRGGLLALSLFCLLISASCDQAQSSSEPTLEAVCNDKQVSLTKISTTRALIEQNRLGPKESCDKFKDSLEQLDDILIAVQSSKICDLSLVDKIRAYHLNYIASADNKARDNIPKSLRIFFISLCFQISAECKMALINNLEYDTREKLTDSDYEEIQFLENHGATLLDLDTKIRDFDDILLLQDLNKAAGFVEETGESRLLIKVKTNNMMRRLVENCNKKFKPFYDKLIMPLVKLSYLGYNYQGELLEREMNELAANSLVRRWYNIVQTCEAFRTIQIFEDPELNELGDGRQALTFITGEEARSLRERNVMTIEEEIAAEEAARGEDGAIVYDPIASHDDDELWITDQKELAKLVDKYKASLTEADRVRSNLVKKLIDKIRSTIKSGKVLMLASELVKSRFSSAEKDSVSTTSVNEEIITLMDEAVSQDEIDRGEAPADPLDGPVAGNKGGKAVSRRYDAMRPRGVPAKTVLVPTKKDGTRTSLKVFNLANRFLPGKMDLAMWIVFIIGCLMVGIAIFTG